MNMLPITLMKPTDTLPRKYRLHRHSQLCKNCGTESAWTEFFHHNDVPVSNNRWSAHLVPSAQIDYNLPIDVIVIPTRHVPVCHCCVATINLSSKPDPTSTEEWKRQYVPQWAAAERAKIAQAESERKAQEKEAIQAEKRAKRAGATAPTIDDLLNI